MVCPRSSPFLLEASVSHVTSEESGLAFSMVPFKALKFQAIQKPEHCGNIGFMNLVSSEHLNECVLLDFSEERIG